MTPRPPKKPEEKRSEYLQVRMTKSERACMQAGARASGQALSNFIRTAAMEKATLITHGKARPADEKPAKARR